MPTISVGSVCKESTKHRRKMSSGCVCTEHVQNFLFLVIIPQTAQLLTYFTSHEALQLVCRELQLSQQTYGGHMQTAPFCTRGSSVHDFGILGEVLVPVPMALYSKQYWWHPCTRKLCSSLKFKSHRSPVFSGSPVYRCFSPMD